MPAYAFDSVPSPPPIVAGSGSANIPTSSSNHDDLFPFRKVATSASISNSPSSTPAPSVSTPASEVGIVSEEDGHLGDLAKCVAIGCLHLDNNNNNTQPPAVPGTAQSIPDWVELIFSKLPEEIKQIIGTQTSRLLEARWIRLFLLSPTEAASSSAGRLIRVYLLPKDWGRRFIDRRSKILKTALRDLLARVDTSQEAWFGDPWAERRYFDPWANGENVSLYYLFNKLPSPAPSADKVKNRYSRNSVLGLLEAAVPFSYDDPEEYLPVPGLKSRLYPYQARAAALMVQRESAPQLQLDPRLEVRESPTGEKYSFGGRDGSVLQEPRYYETTRGGILAETMGLGKTIICLAVTLTTKGHMPQIPPAYQLPPPTRRRVGRLTAMAAHCAGRHAIPAKGYLEYLEAAEGLDMANCKRLLSDENSASYIPVDSVPCPRARARHQTTVSCFARTQISMCRGTIIVVPRNLLHQWQSEIRKHVVEGALKILVMDSRPKRSANSLSKATEEPNDQDESRMTVQSELPHVRELMEYDVILFTRNRFEQELEGTTVNAPRRDTSERQLDWDDDYLMHKLTHYTSPLKRLHWLRIIIDEGHSFTSGISNAVRLAKQLQVERRWIVSGTPVKNLVGVELDTLQDQDEADPSLLREMAMEQRKTFTADDENTKAAKALGLLATNFLCVRPWCPSPDEPKLEWEDYIYRHEHQYRKTYSGFSTCFLRTLEGLVVKTRPEDVEGDIQLPPMRHRTVYLKPCWYDKMTANLFIQVLRANAITSERSDVDYLFHKNSVQARHRLIKNLRQSNFAWTGFSVENVADTIDTSEKYLHKEGAKFTLDDARQLLESCNIVCDALKSEGWVALSKAHEVGLAVADWPKESEEEFAFAKEGGLALMGITQLLQGQAHVDGQILASNPAQGLDAIGRAARAHVEAIEEAEMSTLERRRARMDKDLKTAVPSSCVDNQPSASPLKKTRRPPALPKVKSSKRAKTARGVQETSSADPSASTSTPSSDPQPSRTSEFSEPIITTTRPRKRKLTLTDHLATLPPDSSLNRTRILGTTSAKLTYLLTSITHHLSTSPTTKILLFYDGDTAAYHIAQSLEALYINHRIYARTLDNTTRSHYIAQFTSDPTLRILLIDVACGALGLNLNAASVVLIVNPINRPGIEAQAIKRAHRIGQTREVLVETLVLEGTIEEAIFRRAKRMSRGEHREARTLEDDNEIIKIIQNAEVLPMEEGEGKGLRQFALLEEAERVFGREGREKYHRVGEGKEKGKEKAEQGSKKRVCVLQTGKGKRKEKEEESSSQGGDVTGPSNTGSAPVCSIFGG